MTFEWVLCVPKSPNDFFCRPPKTCHSWEAPFWGESTNLNLNSKGNWGTREGAGRIGMGNRKDTQLGLQGNENPPFEGGRGQQGQLIVVQVVHCTMVFGQGDGWRLKSRLCSTCQAQALARGCIYPEKRGGHLFLILPKALYGLSANKVMFWKPKWASHQKTNMI